MNTIKTDDIWPNYESVAYQDNQILFPSNLGHFDFGEHVLPLSWEYDLPVQDIICDTIPLMENVDMDSLHTYDSNMQLLTNLQEVADDFYPNLGTEFEVIGDMFSALEPEKPKVLMLTDNGGSVEENITKTKRCRSEEKSNKMHLSRESICQYFYMPIAQAAKELNIGVTHLKKRCRELGIRRWPHRKLSSLQNLIKSVQELGTEHGIQETSEGMLKQAIEILENEKKLLEEQPDAQLKDKTKRLRQACFKANYKKRKFMGIMDPQSFTFTV